ncbi:MAG: FAD-dependent monooxygenase [Mobilicoccus sp.]|nr:FAD-dependent monooxygenase [Mobilicoccus sp.]
MRTRVAVIGGSIAGAAVAGLLDPARFEVTLHEERPERREAGSSLALWPGAWRALDALGLTEAVRAESEVITGGALRDATGLPLIEADVPMTLILRPRLLALLDDAIPASVRRVDGRVEDPASLPADLVVGADGVRSIVRRSAFGEHLTPRLSPWLALRGLLPHPPAQAGEYWGRGDLAGVVPAPGGRTYWFTTHVSDLGSRPPGTNAWSRSLEVDAGEALAEARAVFGAHPRRAPTVLQALEHADPATTLAQRIYEAPPMRRLVHGRAVLVGDAAHAMTPNLGRGACEALIDAHVLAGVLHRHDLGTALRIYEARRLAPGAVLRLASRALMHAALSRRLAGPRDAAARAAGAVTAAVTG